MPSSAAPASPPSDAAALRQAAAGALAQRFPVRWLEEHAVLPLAQSSTDAHVAVGAPPSPQVRDAVARVLRVPITWVTVPSSELRAALHAAPRTSPERDAQVTSDGRSAADDALTGDHVARVDDLRAAASREPVVQLVNAMLAEAVRTGASDIHVESRADGVHVRMRRDGVLHDVQTLGADFRAAVLSRLKVLAGLDIAERRLPQDGRARIRVGARELDLRVSTLPALHGEGIVLRLLDASVDGTPRSLDTLGMDAALRDGLRALLQRQSGLLLVTGPTGSGKTTTLYAALSERATPDVKTVTVEDPVEYRLDGVTQLPVNLRAGFGFPQALRAMLRHDPDVILVGEMRDSETAEIAVRAALTGHLVLSTVHTTDAVGALTRLRDMGVPAYLLAATLQGVLAQRLVRRSCAACAAPRAPDAADLALFAPQAPPAQVLAGAGCTRCSDTGFAGRIAIAELVRMDDALRDALVRGASTSTLRTMARDAGSGSLRADGQRAVRDGLTTGAEVLRVLGEAESEIAPTSTPHA
ncbi:MAG: GspE/PulE family protein [Gemmatimonadetes bacterium]|nr:GspE/PulE family protein [Gemmatimonadota bacterium]